VGHKLGLGRGRRPDDGLHLRVLDQVHGCNESNANAQQTQSYSYYVSHSSRPRPMTPNATASKDFLRTYVTFFLNNTIIYYSNEQYMVEIYKLSPAIIK
jgi:hypothetical protein